MSQAFLRPVESADVATVASFLAHPDLVGRRGLHGDRDHPRSIAAITKAVEPLVDPEFGDAWVVEADGVVGLATVGWWWDAHTPWAYVVIDPDHQHRGHGTAAARQVVNHLFSTSVAHLVEYSVPSWDADSLSFADSVGGLRTGARRRAGIRNGRYYDSIEFALTREMWRERHGVGG